jgi:hypothetical protein
VRRSLALTLVFLTACAVKGSVARVPSDGSVSLLLVVLEDGQPPALIAADTDGQSFFTVPFHGATTQIFALHFDCSLDSLQIPGGPLRTSDAGAPLPLSFALEIASATVAAGQDPAGVSFAPLTAIPDVLSSLRFAPEIQPLDPCATFTAELHAVPVPDIENDQLPVVLALPDGSGLVASVLGHFFRLTDGELVALTQLPPWTPHSGGFVSPNGEIWLAGPMGEMARGDLIRGFATQVPRSDTTTIGVVRLIGPTSADVPFELFSTSHRQIEHYLQEGETGRWETLAMRVSRMQNLRDDELWLGPGDAMFTSFSIGEILHYRDGMLMQSFLPPVPGADHDQVHAIGNTPLGLVARSNTNNTYKQLPSGDWVLLPQMLAPNRVTAIVPFERGFLMAGDFGQLVQYIPESGFCSARSYAPEMIDQLRPLAGGRFLISGGRRAVTGILTPVIPHCGAR